MAHYRVLFGADDDVGAWVCDRAGGQWFKGMGGAIGITCAESLVAGVTYTGYNGANVWMGMAADPDHRGRWLNRDILHRAIFQYPFRQLGCKRISAQIYETNLVSQDVAIRLGFHREATLVDAAPDGHMLVYALKTEDCKWLR